MPAKKKSTMSAEHKEALAIGREEGRAVKDYLEALESARPKRGRKRTPESIAKRLEAIDLEFLEAAPIRRLALAQEKIDLEAELATGEESIDLTQVEAQFVAVAATYGERKGISYAAWREVGVPAATLREAGISRSAG